MTTPLTRDVKALSAILISGVVELACAAGLQNQRTRVVAGWASAALLLAVYPANLKMAPISSLLTGPASGPRHLPGCRCRSH